MTDNTVVSDFLVRTLQQTAPRPLKGSELSVLVKAAHPEFSAVSLGYRNLREFIRRQATDIVEVGHAGMDICYSLRTSQAKQEAGNASSKSVGLADDALDQLTKDLRAWKTFTSPESPFRLYLTDKGVVRSMHASSRPLPEWKEIQRISPETLLQIGRDFVANLDEVQKSVLVPTFQEPTWWFPFVDRLQSLGLKYKWIEFRRQRIRREFEKRIEEIGMPPFRQPSEIGAVSSSLEVSTPTQSELSFRKIAADVVQRMTESELRRLNLPLGYVVDSLTTR